MEKDSNKEDQFVILAVEDNPAHAELFRRNLPPAERRVILFNHALDGEEGLDYLYNRNKFEDINENPRPNIILLDLRLPKVSGLEMLKIIKSTNEFKSIPVIVFSSSQANPDIIQAAELGVNSYITKPTDFKQFSLLAESMIDYWSRWDQISNFKSLDHAK